MNSCRKTKPQDNSVSFHSVDCQTLDPEGTAWLSSWLWNSGPDVYSVVVRLLQRLWEIHCFTHIWFMDLENAHNCIPQGNEEGMAETQCTWLLPELYWGFSLSLNMWQGVHGQDVKAKSWNEGCLVWGPKALVFVFSSGMCFSWHLQAFGLFLWKRAQSKVKLLVYSPIYVFMDVWIFYTQKTEAYQQKQTEFFMINSSE